MSAPALRCAGTLELETDDGHRHEVDLADLTLEFVETFEPSLVLIHGYRAPGVARRGVQLAFDLLEWGAGYEFADVSVRGPARIVGHRDLAARVGDIEVELRLNRAG